VTQGHSGRGLRQPICTGCDGRTLLDEGTVVGHKIMGAFDEVGEAAQSTKDGDRVVSGRKRVSFWCGRSDFIRPLVLCPGKPKNDIISQ
jgi:threonine dehydrogenase-like Zn-dependent dehydrogenase